MTNILHKISPMFERLEIKTKLSRQEILKRVKDFADPQCTDYCGSESEDGFCIAEKTTRFFVGGHSFNAFAPIAKAKIVEENGVSTVSIILRMRILTLILFAPIYVISLLTLVCFPLVLLLLHFAFQKPTRRLKDFIEDLLIENDSY